MIYLLLVDCVVERRDVPEYSRDVRIQGCLRTVVGTHGGDLALQEGNQGLDQGRRVGLQGKENTITSAKENERRIKTTGKRK